MSLAWMSMSGSLTPRLPKKCWGSGTEIWGGPERFVSEKSPGSLAKGWETAETAASEMGTSTETPPGYPLQHAPPSRVLADAQNIKP